MSSTDYLNAYRKLLENNHFNDVTSSHDRERSNEIAFYKNKQWSIKMDGINIILMKNNTGFWNDILNDDSIVRCLEIIDNPKILVQTGPANSLDPEVKYGESKYAIKLKEIRQEQA